MNSKILVNFYYILSFCQCGLWQARHTRIKLVIVSDGSASVSYQDQDNPDNVLWLLPCFCFLIDRSQWLIRLAASWWQAYICFPSKRACLHVACKPVLFVWQPRSQLDDLSKKETCASRHDDTWNEKSNQPPTSFEVCVIRKTWLSLKNSNHVNIGKFQLMRLHYPPPPPPPRPPPPIKIRLSVASGHRAVQEGLSMLWQMTMQGTVQARLGFKGTLLRRLNFSSCA